MSSISAYERFRALHDRPGAFVMPNAWDGASAVLLKRSGFEVLGSSSFAIAAAMGRQDGTHAVSLAESITNAALLAHVTGLPVNGDLEDGYGPTPEDCADTVEAAIHGGLAGLGIEDTTADPARPIHDFDDAIARVRAAARAARGRILLTGRTDNFLNGRPDLDDTIRRLTAFAEVGADVLYAPGRLCCKPCRSRSRWVCTVGDAGRCRTSKGVTSRVRSCSGRSGGIAATGLAIEISSR